MTRKKAIKKGHTKQNQFNVVAQTTTENDRFAQKRKAHLRRNEVFVHHRHHVVLESIKENII